MAAPTYSQADSDCLPDVSGPWNVLTESKETHPFQRQPDRWPLLDEQLIDLAVQVSPFFTRSLKFVLLVHFEPNF
jgi:hypothetical protein